MTQVPDVRDVHDPLHWRWYSIGESTRYPGAWVAVNRATDQRVLCSSENAALRIIELAYALKHGDAKPHNHKTLETKARCLENIHGRAARYYTWDRSGPALAYDTEPFDIRPR